MSRLRGLPLDKLKVPKPFIDGIADDDNDFAVTRGIIDFGHHLNLGLVAEGIETAEQLDRVGMMGCDYAQGYHFARPGPAETMDPRMHIAARRRPDEPVESLQAVAAGV